MKLENILTHQTFKLKKIFLTKTLEWATRDFNQAIKMCDWTTAKWCEHYGVEVRELNQLNDVKIKFPENFFNTNSGKRYLKKSREVVYIKQLGLGGHILEALKKAEKRYKDSIFKLAQRLESKKLNKNNIVVRNTSLDENISCTISDGINSYNAYTIIASGQIQRPHYRFLIK